MLVLLWFLKRNFSEQLCSPGVSEFENLNLLITPFAIYSIFFTFFQILCIRGRVRGYFTILGKQLTFIAHY